MRRPFEAQDTGTVEQGAVLTKLLKVAARAANLLDRLSMANAHLPEYGRCAEELREAITAAEKAP